MIHLYIQVRTLHRFSSNRLALAVALGPACAASQMVSLNGMEYDTFCDNLLIPIILYSMMACDGI